MAALPEPFNPYRLVEFSVEARLDSVRIVPGQPIGLNWMLSNTLQGDVGDLIVTISFDSNHLHTSPPIGSYLLGTWQHILLLAPSQKNLAAALYSKGVKKLDVTVRSSVPGLGPWVCQADVEVALEELGDSWWSWDNPVGLPGYIDWKTAYSLGGSITNCSTWAKMWGTVTARQIDPAGATGEQRNSSVGELVAKASAGVTFTPSISQNWRWLMPGAWIVVGPTEKLFRYTLKIALSDQFDTSYTLAPSQLHVPIRVPKSKLALAGAALGSQIDAAAFLALAAAAAAGVITSPLAGGFLTVAGGFEAAAIRAGTLALDPPRPNRRYEARVKLRRFDWRLPKEFGPLPNLRRSVEAMSWVLGLLKLVAEVESRLLTSRMFRHTRSVSLHRQSLAQARQQLDEYQVILTDHAAAAAMELDDVVSNEVHDLRVQGALASPKLTDLFDRFLAERPALRVAIPRNYLVRHATAGLLSPGRYFQTAAMSTVEAAKFGQSVFSLDKAQPFELLEEGEPQPFELLEESEIGPIELSSGEVGSSEADF
jgi:hypothetical protein